MSEDPSWAERSSVRRERRKRDANLFLDQIDRCRLSASLVPGEGLMDLRKLVFGLTALAIIGGLLLVYFAPGGWFNSGQTERAAVKTPVGLLEITAHETKSSVWPTVGYVLLGIGRVGVVAFLCMKSSHSSP